MAYGIGIIVGSAETSADHPLYQGIEVDGGDDDGGIVVDHRFSPLVQRDTTGLCETRFSKFWLAKCWVQQTGPTRNWLLISAGTRKRREATLALKTGLSHKLPKLTFIQASCAIAVQREISEFLVSLGSSIYSPRSVFEACERRKR